MKNCPTCGVSLDARLVDAITNPSMDESCPDKRKPERQEPTRVDPSPVHILGAPVPVATLIPIAHFAGAS